MAATAVARTRSPISVPVAASAQCEPFAPRETASHADAKSTTIAPTATRQPRTMAATRAVDSGSDLRHRETCTSRQTVTKGTKNIANDITVS